MGKKQRSTFSAEFKLDTVMEGLRGEKSVRLLLRQLEHSCSVGRVRVVTTDSQHNLPRYANLVKGLTITRPNQVWKLTSLTSVWGDGLSTWR